MDIEYLNFIQELGNFVDTLIVVDENYRICSHKVFRQGGLSWEEVSSIGRKPTEVFSGFTQAVVNTFLVRQHGRTVGAVITGQILDGDLVRYSINVPEPQSLRKHRLYEVADIIGGSPEMAALRQKLPRVAASRSNVFIHGETGTGKELVAQSLHTSGPNRDGRFISQNCAAIPQTLLESIFFGTARGGFTGAQDKPGIFELADGGTIFLDELNSMDPGMQAKLLKAIEEKTVTRVGGSQPRRFDVRIIAAINQSPERCLAEKSIRADLFYRLAQVQIELPPLRERRSDIRDLARHFIGRFNQEMCTRVEGVSPGAMDLLEAYGWPGNVRELRNVLESAFNFISGPFIEEDDLPEDLRGAGAESASPAGAQGESLHASLDRYEKYLLTAKARQVRTLTELADSLNISRQVLTYKLRKHGLKLFGD
jgi:arginine utilization regulatory protein